MPKPTRPKRGRPVVLGETVYIGARVPTSMVDRIDKWADATGVKRSDAIRQLIEAGLKRRPKP
jgi:metal-responsive CopG/Arc/MetJ family transcriptional regulator